jgi:hypothetical protein
VLGVALTEIVVMTVRGVEATRTPIPVSTRSVPVQIAFPFRRSASRLHFTIRLEA